MRELQKRAARALMALLQNDPEKALKELNVYPVQMEEGEPILKPVGLSVCHGQRLKEYAEILDEMFGYPCQEGCGGTVRAKAIGVCDCCHIQHFSGAEEKRYRKSVQEGRKEG